MSALYDIQHDFDVMDAHHHVGEASGHAMSAEWSAAMAAVPAAEAEARELEVRLEIMDRQCVRQAAIMANQSYERPNGLADTRTVNDRLAAYRDRLPDRFPAAVGVTEPLYGEPGLLEVDRCAIELGMAAMSFHTAWQGVAIDSPQVHRCVERIAERDMVPFVNAVAGSQAETLWQVSNLAASFPDLPMLVMDGFSSFERLQEAPSLLERHEHLVFDTALLYDFASVVPLVERFGAHRFALGTNVYSWPVATEPTQHVPQILLSDLDDLDKAQILGGTLRNMLNPAADRTP